jgi:hypothetical protein
VKLTIFLYLVPKLRMLSPFRGKCPRYIVGCPSEPVWTLVRRTFLSLSGIEHGFPGSLIHSLVTKVTEL